MRPAGTIETLTLKTKMEDSRMAWGEKVLYFNLQNTYGGRRNLTPTNCPMTFPHATPCPLVYTYTQKDTDTESKN